MNKSVRMAVSIGLCVALCVLAAGCVGHSVRAQPVDTPVVPLVNRMPDTTVAIDLSNLGQTVSRIRSGGHAYDVDMTECFRESILKYARQYFGRAFVYDPSSGAEFDMLLKVHCRDILAYYSLNEGQWFATTRIEWVVDVLDDEGRKDRQVSGSGTGKDAVTPKVIYKNKVASERATSDSLTNLFSKIPEPGGGPEHEIARACEKLVPQLLKDGKLAAKTVAVVVLNPGGNRTELGQLVGAGMELKLTDANQGVKTVERSRLDRVFDEVDLRVAASSGTAESVEELQKIQKLTKAKVLVIGELTGSGGERVIVNARAVSIGPGTTGLRLSQTGNWTMRAGGALLKRVIRRANSPLRAGAAWRPGDSLSGRRRETARSAVARRGRGRITDSGRPGQRTGGREQDREY